MLQPSLPVADASFDATLLPSSRTLIPPPPVSTAEPAAPQRAATLPTDVRQSWAYRVRLPLTAVTVLSGVSLALLNRPPFPLRSVGGLSLTAAGLVLLVAGIALRLWALGSISERKTRQLVTTGPYSLCRNPLYLGTLLIVCAFVVFWQSLTMALLLLPAVLLYQFGVVPVEEQVLTRRYGAEFDAYCCRTPRWVPRLSGYVREDNLALWSVGVMREAQCGLWWLAFAGLSLWITSLREAGLGRFL